MGRPAHKPTEEGKRTAKALAAYGIPQDEIAEVLGICPHTLRKHYSEVLRGAATEANAKVAENLFRTATGAGRESVTAGIFWLKTRAGWRERDKDDRQGGNAGTLTIRWEDDRDRPTVSTEGGSE